MKNKTKNLFKAIGIIILIFFIMFLIGLSIQLIPKIPPRIYLLLVIAFIFLFIVFKVYEILQERSEKITKQTKKNKSKIYPVEFSLGKIFQTILIFGVFFLGVMFLLDYHSEPEFKITKEECWNETDERIRSLHSGCFFGCDYLSTTNDEMRECYEYCTKGKEYAKYQTRVCKKVEVDEINGGTRFCLEMPKDIREKDRILWADSSSYFEWCYKSYRDKPFPILFYDISKEDLTIKWLNDNCEVSKCKGDGFIHENACCYDVGYFDGKKHVKWGKEYCDYEKVLEYKCGEYQVEALN